VRCTTNGNDDGVVDNRSSGVVALYTRANVGKVGVRRGASAWRIALGCAWHSEECACALAGRSERDDSGSAQRGVRPCMKVMRHKGVVHMSMSEWWVQDALTRRPHSGRRALQCTPVAVYAHEEEG
jgi:hypothetical protein